MFGINGSELIVLLVVAAVVLGPERLPEYAAQLGRLVRQLRQMASGASDKLRSEMGDEFDDVDWTKLDPRQYDPRRIVREALQDSIDLDDPLGLRADDDQPRVRRTAVQPVAPEATVPAVSESPAVPVAPVTGAVPSAARPASAADDLL